ncbi:hypothetical protein COW46_00720 [Candidatus Gracilibacteria bacterium CG17_big_fil_post_rev_8_21_14_2_50_48_13]|nr:MAG: hypothetical protein COW46_00720 [Candidatus Gracilibacteria bacterium CG17_big_fil_post_rev_8_21_14_2_50_48_13]
MNLSDHYLWANEAITHMEDHTYEGMDTEQQISFVIAYQTLRNYRNALLSIMGAAESAYEEYEGFLLGNYPRKEDVDLTDEQD